MANKTEKAEALGEVDGVAAPVGVTHLDVDRFHARAPAAGPRRRCGPWSPEGWREPPSRRGRW